MSPGWRPLRRTTRRKTPRFGVTCEPIYSRSGSPAPLERLTITVANESDVAHGIDEALVRYDDGRVGLIKLDPIKVARIDAHSSVSFEVTAAEIGAQPPATRCRVLVFNGKFGRRLEWSSKELPLLQH